jgi:ribose transport system substrate-binding protein
MKTSKLLYVLLTLLVAALVLSACGGAPAAVEPAAEEPAAEEPAAEEPAAEEPAMEEKTYVVGLSNAWIGSEWRSQMLANFEKAAEELGMETVVEHADTDVPGQIAQINNLIAKGVDAIIINPADIAALKPVMDEATSQGIVVVIIDAEIPGDDHVNVVINQKEWAAISARWLVEKLGGEGDIVTIEGYLGHPANEYRMEGVAEVLAANPGINLVGEDTGEWDPATAQQVAANFMASNPGLDGIWTQDGMAEGTLLAVLASGLDYEDWPQVVCEARGSGLRTWKKVLDEHPDFECIAVINPPGCAYDAVYVAYNLLEGKEIDETKLGGQFGNTLYKPLTVIDSDNLQEWLDALEGKADSYTLDALQTPEEIEAYFK